jgi:hypothetical protein
MVICLDRKRLKATGAAATTTEKEFENLASNAEWTQWAKEQAAATHIRVEKLFVDYIV